VILAGKGVRLSGALPAFERVIRKLGVPVATAWTGVDLLSSDDPLYCGRPGDLGGRPATSQCRAPTCCSCSAVASASAR